MMLGAAKINLSGAVATSRANGRFMRLPSRTMAAAPATAEAKTEETTVPEGKAKVYVGKGRFIVDDPTKYPDRTILTGGFAGGEVRNSA